MPGQRDHAFRLETEIGDSVGRRLADGVGVVFCLVGAADVGDQPVDHGGNVLDLEKRNLNYLK